MKSKLLCQFISENETDSPPKRPHCNVQSWTKHPELFSFKFVQFVGSETEKKNITNLDQPDQALNDRTNRWPTLKSGSCSGMSRSLNGELDSCNINEWRLSVTPPGLIAIILRLPQQRRTTAKWFSWDFEHRTMNFRQRQSWIASSVRTSNNWSCAGQVTV